MLASMVQWMAGTDDEPANSSEAHDPASSSEGHDTAVGPAAAPAPLPIDALLGRRVGGLGGRFLRFRAQLFWQEVLPEHAAGASLQFHCDMSSGRNFARIPSAAAVPASGSYVRSVAVAVPDDEVSADEARLVGRALRESLSAGAADDGDASALLHLLCSCHCTHSALDAALCEASRHNDVAAVRLLLHAGARPSAQPDGKGALHIACEEGFEAVARMLVAAEPAAAHAPSAALGGRTPLQVARDADMGGLARRVEEHARACAEAAGQGA